MFSDVVLFSENKQAVGVFAHCERSVDQPFDGKRQFLDLRAGSISGIDQQTFLLAQNLYSSFAAHKTKSMSLNERVGAAAAKFLHERIELARVRCFRIFLNFYCLSVGVSFSSLQLDCVRSDKDLDIAQR